MVDIQHTERMLDAGLDVFGDPASVAVVGASANPAKWGYWLASGALRGKYRRPVHLVNSRAAEVLGEPCASSLSELPGVPELVALCVPAGHVPGVVEEGLRLGVRGFLGITAGVADEPELVRRITAAGGRLIGTNSLGIYDADADLELIWGTMQPGEMAIVSQSGQLGSELAEIGSRHGIGVSRFVSIGNQSDVTAAELLADLADHEATRVVAVYLESFADGAELFEALAMLNQAGKPTVLLTVGASNAGARLARSHTGSLTSAMDVIDAACRRAGVVRAHTPGEVIDIARMLVAAPRPAGRRIAVLGDSGGQSGIAADVASALGLEVPQLSDQLSARIAARLPDGAACTNPVDLAGAGEQDLTNYAALAEDLIGGGEVDAVVLTGYFGCYGRDIPALADTEEAVVDRLGELVARTGLPAVVHTMGAETTFIDALRRNGIPAYERIESALCAVSAAATRPIVGPDSKTNQVVAKPVSPGYWSARGVLAAAGVRFPRAALVRTAADTAAAAEQLSAPYVLKAGWLDHKSEVGGVVTGITDPDRLVAAFDEMRARLGAGEYVVEEQDPRSDTVEILVGARREAGLGPVVVVGAGGTETEVHQDVRLEMAPVSTDTARAMIDGLRCAALLNGWRGRPAVNIDGLTELLSAISRFIADRTDIAEIELNPVRVGVDGPLAVDALVLGATTDPRAAE